MVPSYSSVLRLRARAAAALALLAFAVLAPLPAGAATAERRTVVVLYSHQQELPGLRELRLALTEELQKGSQFPLDVYEEFTGLDRFSGAPFDASLLALLQQKYGARKVDLLVLEGPSAFDFAVDHQFLPGVPVVACYVPKRFVEEARAKRPEITAALPAQVAPKTVELMLALYPKTKRIEMVLGASAYEREQTVRAKGVFAGFAGRVEFGWLNDLTLEQLEARLAAMGDDTLPIYGSLLVDAAGREFNTNEVVGRLSRASRRPLFGVVAEDLGDGVLGGILVSTELAGRVSGQLGARVLAGARASEVPLVFDAGVAPMFDARQLKRFGLREQVLPAGAIIKFREVSLWQTYWREISAGVAVIVLQSLLVGALFVLLRRGRRSEQALAQAESRYRTVADFTHDWELWRRADGGFEYVSPACFRVSGHERREFEERPALMEELVVEEDRPAFRAFNERALRGEQQGPLEYRIRARSGEVRWVEQNSNPVQTNGGPITGTRDSVRDVTSRKQGDLALQSAYKDLQEREAALKSAYREIEGLRDQLEAENSYYKDKVQSVEGSSELIGQSDPIKFLLFRIGQVAPAATTVLIQGETGTGKELVAEAIHKRGPRSARALVKVNCAALPHALAESELFGHERGSFTSAEAQRKGRFELADGATLFLDEVGELPLDLQAKLLRVLQDGTFQRVGGDKTLRVDVRVIAATNRDLLKEVTAGRFREDLWYRLNVFPITVPALRHRKEDLPALVQTFVERSCLKMGRPLFELPRAELVALQGYAWPGNVRELQNVIEQAVLTSEGRFLRLAGPLKAAATARGGGADGFQPPEALETLEAVERAYIVKVLDAAEWKIQGPKGAAAILGMNPSTLRTRMAKLAIQREERK